MKWFFTLLLLVIIVGIAYLLLTRPDFIIRQESVNRAAEGFSNFYGKIRSGSFGRGDKPSDFQITLPDTSEILPRQLQRRSETVLPLSLNWRGTVTDRRFRKGDTLKTRLTEFSRAEDVELFWTLPRDYIVKQYFQTNSSLLGSAHDVGKAIAADFPRPVLVFFCPDARALVVTDKLSPYLQQNCLPTSQLAGL
ncbi:TcpQ domain-containing protein [Arsukibacterium sp.]|uniref:TcpQ domain-containing protein n=1 Tax=Arsukibacterium sp. TaxID=1977258 RepID=UPI002FD98328